MPRVRSLSRLQAFRIALLAAAVSFAFVVPSLAHVTFSGAGDFYSGVLHPFTVPAQVLILSGLGLLFSQKPARRLNAALPFFFLGLAAGLGFAFRVGIGEMPRPVMAAFTAALGALVAAELPLPGYADRIVAFAAALLVGLDSSPGPNQLKTLLLLTAGIFLGVHVLLIDSSVYSRIPQKPWMRVGVRVLGSWIAAGSVMVMALAFRK